MKLSISLTNKTATKSVGDAPSLKRPAAFGTLDDDTPTTMLSNPHVTAAQETVTW
jgi:hypothetical protein